MFTFNKHEMAWATGIFEGEGTIVTSSIGSHILRVTMCDKDVIERLHSVIGLGSVSLKKLKNAPKHWKPQWMWSLYRNGEVYAVLAAMYPLLGERRRTRALKAMTAITPVARGPLKVGYYCRKASHYIASKKDLYKQNRKHKRGTAKWNCRECSLNSPREYRRQKCLSVDTTT